MAAARPEECAIGQEASVSVHAVRALVDTAERAGVPRHALLTAADIEPEWLELTVGYLPRSQVYRLFELALDLSQQPALGLTWYEHLPEQALNVVSQLVNHAGTLRGAFDAVFRFSRLLSEEPGIRLIERDDRVTILCLRLAGASARVQRIIAEMTTAGIYRLVRSFRADAVPLQVSFEYPAPAYRTEYMRAFGATACFEQPFTGIVFAHALLSAPSLYPDEGLYGALQAVAEQRLVRLARKTPYSIRVRDLLAREAAPQRVEMGRIARQLEISVRSLHRRLSDEGASYGALAKDAAATVAKRLMEQEQKTIQEAAFEMGFADASSFHRAFKRWTGITPGTFRNRR